MLKRKKTHKKYSPVKQGVGCKNKNKKKPKLRDFTSTNQPESINKLGVLNEYISVYVKYAICLIAIVVGGYFLYLGIYDDEFSVKLFGIEINCKFVGFAIIIIALVIMWKSKAKVHLD